MEASSEGGFDDPLSTGKRGWEGGEGGSKGRAAGGRVGGNGKEACDASGAREWTHADDEVKNELV